MPGSKKSYEYYWKLTLEYSDIHSEQYNDTLKMIIKFIDERNGRQLEPGDYTNLQEEINLIFNKADMASIRKSINQFVKLGFVKPYLIGYHSSAKQFCTEENKEKKRSIFSEILYSSASFNSSVTVKNEEREINFFIKTLEKNKTLNREQIAGLMRLVPSDYNDGCLNKEELEKETQAAKEINFEARKYNQINFMITIFKSLDGIKYKNNTFYPSNDLEIEDEVELSKKRDNYLQKLYKNRLKIESEEIFGDRRCMISQVPYYAMIASHIKPFYCSDKEEEYDSQNGLLLGKDIDYLFDKGYISINVEGKILVSSNLKVTIVNYHKLDDIFLDVRLLTNERKKYFIYHRNNVFKG